MSYFYLSGMSGPAYWAARCWDVFLRPQAYYWCRISYQNHARLNGRDPWGT
jgi:hypothetical protein